MNPFSNILTDQFKQIYNDAIDSIIDPSTGLVQTCIIRYASAPSSETLCNNCIYDNISKISSNIYNSFGPKPFPDGGICPVCIGAGIIIGGISNTVSETIKLAVIIDSKKFINVADTANINNVTIQTVCKADLLNKLHNAVELELHGSTYQRISEPQYCGLSDHRYITILWSSK